MRSLLPLLTYTGAFAFFECGKFTSVYESLATPAAAGHLRFAGTALSTRHAWVDGALDSAWRAMCELPLVELTWQPRLGKFFRIGSTAASDGGAPRSWEARRGSPARARRDSLRRELARAGVW